MFYLIPWQDSEEYVIWQIWCDAWKLYYIDVMKHETQGCQNFLECIDHHADFCSLLLNSFKTCMAALILDDMKHAPAGQLFCFLIYKVEFSFKVSLTCVTWNSVAEIQGSIKKVISSEKLHELNIWTGFQICPVMAWLWQHICFRI